MWLYWQIRKLELYCRAEAGKRQDEELASCRIYPNVKAKYQETVFKFISFNSKIIIDFEYSELYCESEK